MQQQGPHQGRRTVEAGAPLADARAAVILIHGRGATAESIMPLADELDQPDVAYLAPQAGGNAWYPYSFLAPLDRNEPGLSSGLQAIDDIRQRIEEAGIPPARLFVAGFSQGACLALEYVARHARRYGGAVGFSGGLIGSGMRGEGEPPNDKVFEYDGSLEGTPVFLGCSDVDPHIPVERVRQTAEALRALNAAVTERIYEGMAHTVNREEIAHFRQMLVAVTSGG